MLFLRTNRAFTMIELMVVMTIGVLILLLTYAPYNFYSDRSKVRLSAERVNQVINEAKLLTSGGYTQGNGKNGDILLSFFALSGSIVMESIPHWGNLESQREFIKVIPLEDLITLSDFSPSPLFLLYRALSASGIPLNTQGEISTFTGVVIGKWWATRGLLSTFVWF